MSPSDLEDYLLEMQVLICDGAIFEPKGIDSPSRLAQP